MKVHLGAFRLPSLPGLSTSGTGIFSTVRQVTGTVPAPERAQPAPILSTIQPVPPPERAPAPIWKTIGSQPGGFMPPTFTLDSVAAQMSDCKRRGGTWVGDTRGMCVFPEAAVPTPASVASAAFTPTSLPATTQASTPEPGLTDTPAPTPSFTLPPPDLTSAEPPAVSPVAPATPPAPPATGGAFSAGGALGAGVAGFLVAGPLGAAVGVALGGKLFGKKA